MLKNTRRALCLLVSALLCLSSVLTLSAQDANDVYSDPSGFFTMPTPEGWTNTSLPPLGHFTHESGATLTTVAVSTDDLDTAKDSFISAVALQLVNVKPTQSNPVPLPSGLWTQDLYLQPDGSVAALISHEKDGVAYLLLLQAPDMAATQTVTPALQTVLLGFTIGEPIDLTSATAAPLSDEDLTALDAYIAAALERFDIPGASVAVVQNGEVIFSQGYGVTALEGGTPVDADTLFMIGSTTKSMTSLLAATLVDEGKLDWDQPVSELLPDFALSDAEATRKIRYRDLLNMTSGVPRYDAPMFMEEADPLRLLAMVDEPELVAQPGEVFNYNNQMVALGGFAAAVAAGTPFGMESDEAYAQLLQERVLDPVGMTRSTLDAAVALADDNHATSHTLDVTSSLAFTAIDPAFERFASPVAPAGALWSSANDMARYLITQINLGVTPDGTRIVSEDNLQETHTPAISMGGSSYGMGWMIGTWNGLTLLEHGGGTLGYVSDFSYLQEAGLGVIVLANRTGSNSFTAAVREYVYETAYGLEHTADERYMAANDSLNAMMSQGLSGVTLSQVEEADVADFLGSYEHGLTLLYDDGMFVQTAYGRLPLYDIGMANRYLVGGALAGFGIELSETDGVYSVTVGSLTDPSQKITLLKE